jgi:ATP-dependent helicase HrpB
MSDNRGNEHMTGRAVLPIDDALPALLHALTVGANAVLVAPPGAGKTTRVPLALRTAEWLGHRKIVMLEPRRLAARAAAHFMARILGERVGDLVGYRVRGDTRISGRTQIEVVTEGVLTRLLSDDAALESYGAVVFDEFHERSLHADVGLALTLETQQHLRPDLRVLVMSATLESERVAELLRVNHVVAPIVRSAGKMFPVRTEYREPRSGDRVDATVARAVRESLAGDDGDILVFLPGMSEQRRVEERLRNDDAIRTANATVHVLHGSLPLVEQDAAIAPAPPGARKVVLATSIAETSLTIEGVRVVVDCGLSRVPKYEARAGLTRLATVRVSRASADQRRGRAGRVAPGICYRLWHEADDHALMPRTSPEILEADLSSLALELANAGVVDPTTVRWMDEPPAGAFAHARELLVMLGAVDADGRITGHGKKMAALPLAPRLAHLLIVARERGLGPLGADIVALLEERDVLRSDGAVTPADMRLRIEALRKGGGSADSGGLHGAWIDRDAMRRVRELVAQLRETHSTGSADDVAHTGALLALAFPDRVAQRRTGSAPRFLLRSGTGVALPAGDALANEQWLAVAELEGSPPEYRVARAAAMTTDEVLSDFASQIVAAPSVVWHDESDSVRARRRTMLGALVIEDRVWPDADSELVRNALVQEVRRRGVDALPWSNSGARVRERLLCVHHYLSDWPDVRTETLNTQLATWFAPHVSGMRKWSELERLDWSEVLLGMIPWSQRAALDRLVPTHMEVPSGSKIAIDYSNPELPVLAVKLQEVFGWTTTPTICDGRVALTLHLLSPAQRPVQVTRDLEGFWRSSYFEVRKEMRGRYPRHPWPEDPLTAVATRRAKPRGT